MEIYNATVFIVIALIVFVGSLAIYVFVHLFQLFPPSPLILLYNFVDQEDFRNMDYSRITYTLKEDIFQQLSNCNMHMRITWGAH